MRPSHIVQKYIITDPSLPNAKSIPPFIIVSSKGAILLPTTPWRGHCLGWEVISEHTFPIFLHYSQYKSLPKPPLILELFNISARVPPVLEVYRISSCKLNCFFNLSSANFEFSFLGSKHLVPINFPEPKMLLLLFPFHLSFC